MKRLLPCLLVLGGLALAPPLPAKDVPPRFKTIEVKHFTVAPGVPISADFVNFFYDGLLAHLPKEKVAERVVADGGAVPDAEAADSAVVEGVFTEYFKSGGFKIGHVNVDLKIYRRSDHVLLKALAPSLPFKPSPLNRDENVGKFTGGRAAFFIQQGLK